MGGGSMLTPSSFGTSRGLADPHIISNLDANNQPFSTIYSASPFKPSSSICTCRDQTCNTSLDSMHIREDKTAKGSCCDCVFGPVPTHLEVEKAISDLQKFMLGLSASQSDLNSLQPVLNCYESRMLQSPGCRRIHDAFRMLETEPSMQKMVLSISCDQAVWEAILKNEAVQNLQSSLSADLARPVESNNDPCLARDNQEDAEKLQLLKQKISTKGGESQRSREESSIADLILKWILRITMSKIVELLEKFGLIAAEIFQPTEKVKPTSELDDLLEEKVRSSVLLSVVILMIVVVTRNHGA